MEKCRYCKSVASYVNAFAAYQVCKFPLSTSEEKTISKMVQCEGDIEKCELDKKDIWPLINEVKNERRSINNRKKTVKNNTLKAIETIKDSLLSIKTETEAFEKRIKELNSLIKKNESLKIDLEEKIKTFPAQLLKHKEKYSKYDIYFSKGLLNPLNQQDKASIEIYKKLYDKDSK